MQRLRSAASALLPRVRVRRGRPRGATTLEHPANSASAAQEVFEATPTPVGVEALGLSKPWARPPLTRLRWQLPLVVAVTAVLPGIALELPRFWDIAGLTSASNSFALAIACAISALLLFRRLERFPGIASFAQIAPSVAMPYGAAFGFLILARVDYSRSFLALSTVACLALLGYLWFYYRRRSRPVAYLLPGARSFRTQRLRLFRLETPATRVRRNSIIAADLRADLNPDWQRFILNAMLAGIPVYDSKALREAATGKVEISHLSENTAGSVLPNLAYLRVKRVVDIALAIAALPFVLLILLVFGLAIRLDSPGSIFFTQPRVGFRGKSFKVIKFRTMRTDADAQQASVDAAMTKDDDPRITRVGRFLRKHRIDELPQALNVLMGQMSWIGPRPEAVPLARLYEGQIPFYGYRHMVRPGISGWAQVNQGHVVEVDAIREKLNYDFYYIKNVSAWLDALIAVRTARILLFGVGAR